VWLRLKARIPSRKAQGDFRVTTQVPTDSGGRQMTGSSSRGRSYRGSNCQPVSGATAQKTFHGLTLRYIYPHRCQTHWRRQPHLPLLQYGLKRKCFGHGKSKVILSTHAGANARLSRLPCFQACWTCHSWISSCATMTTTPKEADGVDPYVAYDLVSRSSPRD
jgi:hypothetical protein